MHTIIFAEQIVCFARR